MVVFVQLRRFWGSFVDVECSNGLVIIIDWTQTFIGRCCVVLCSLCSPV